MREISNVSENKRCGKSSGNNRSKKNASTIFELQEFTTKFRDLIRLYKIKNIKIKVEILRVKGTIITGRKERDTLLTRNEV